MTHLMIGLAASAAILCGALDTASTASIAHADELRVATLAPDGSLWMKTLNKGAAEADSQTEGRVKLKYFAGGVQGDEKDVVRKMKLGQLDGAALTSVGLSLIDESVRVLELPSMFKDVNELDYVRRKMWPTFRKRFEKKGFHLGDPGDVGFIFFFTNNEVKSISDLKKAKIWMWSEDQIVKSLFKRLGANGVPLGVPDVLPSLTTGRINAAYSSPYAAVALQWHTKVKYATTMPMSYAIGASVIKTDKWSAISAADQKSIEKIQKVQGKKLRKTIRKGNKRAIKAIQRAGVKIVETPAAMVTEFEGHAQKVWQEHVGKTYSKADLDKVLKYRDEYRAKHP